MVETIAFFSILAAWKKQRAQVSWSSLNIFESEALFAECLKISMLSHLGQLLTLSWVRL